MQDSIISATISKYIDYEGEEKEELLIILNNNRIPSCNKSFYQRRYDYYLHVAGDFLRLRIPLYEGMVRRYYSDYKNYYYLPLEDQAVHKSVAQFVDKDHKEKATPQNCYTKIEVTESWLHSEQLIIYVNAVLESFDFSSS